MKALALITLAVVLLTSCGGMTESGRVRMLIQDGTIHEESLPGMYISLDGADTAVSLSALKLRKAGKYSPKVTLGVYNLSFERFEKIVVDRWIVEMFKASDTITKTVSYSVVETNSPMRTTWNAQYTEYSSELLALGAVDTLVITSQSYRIIKVID